ncbi:MAG: hypothetical protein PHV59_09875 [Victivallales bacterium]|nr:hypothetical protein [Victivallales bacterium]
MIRSRKLTVFWIAAALGLGFCRAAENNGEDNGNNGTEVPKSAWIELGFWSPVQLFDDKTDIKVFRFSTIYTYNKSVSGLDCGLICYSGNADGLQAAWSNHTDGIMNGLTFGLFNIAEIEMNGMQAGIYNRAGSDSMDDIATKTACSSGMQWGWANCADAVFTGFQLGITNVSTTLFNGLQIGVVNISEHPDPEFEQFQTKAYQQGKDKRSCLQIGLINFNPKGWLPVTLLINF